MQDNSSVPDSTDIHFTYKKKADMNSLCQGDILERTDNLDSILKRVHPYFLNKQYKYFMVLTQSCDLVKRGNHCKSEYITLAAVREFDQFFETKLEQEHWAENIKGYLFSDTRKSQTAYQFLERLYNNTDPNYFFLYKEESLDFNQSMIASLQVSIALKSELHYEDCLKAKKLELSDEFKAKLGWLVGNIYSRVGTTDWESIMTAKERAKMLQDELSAHCIICEKEIIKAIKEKSTNDLNAIQSETDIKNFIEKYIIESKYDKVIKAIESIINSSTKEISKNQKDTLINKFKNNSKLKMLLSN